jgi:outer membrane protein assembly factor BamB
LRERVTKCYDYPLERRGVKKALVFSLVVFAFSCSLFRTRIQPYPTGAIFPLEEAGRVEFEGRIVGELAKDEAGQLFFSTDKGYLYCFDSSTQKISWQFASPAPYGCPPALAPERLFVWNQDNSVFCLDKKGTLLWQVKVSERISSPVSLGREKVYLGTETGSLLALSQASGELLWGFETGGEISVPPVFFGNQVYLGGGDGQLYNLSAGGRLRRTIDIGSPILVTPLVDGHHLYIGAEDRTFCCYDLRNMKKKWMITAGGRLLARPQADEKRVYFPASNGVLYALKKKGGDILWWWISPSRSRYELGSDGEKLLATSSSRTLYSLDRKTGKVLGKYDAEEEIRSNPVWEDPYLFFALYDPSVSKGSIVLLHKEVGVKLTASLDSPQPVGTEISFTAAGTGFYRPQFEFSLVKGEERTVVKEASEQTAWVWFAEDEGIYIISVQAKDEKESKEAEIKFEIIKKEGENVRQEKVSKEVKNEPR